MPTTLERVIKSKAMKVLALKPFRNAFHKSPQSAATLEDCALQNPNDMERKISETKFSLDTLKWKYFACLLDRMFFLFHVIFLVIVFSSYQNAFYWFEVFSESFQKSKFISCCRLSFEQKRSESKYLDDLVVSKMSGKVFFILGWVINFREKDEKHFQNWNFRTKRRLNILQAWFRVIKRPLSSI